MVLHLGLITVRFAVYLVVGERAVFSNTVQLRINIVRLEAKH
jgi:hypothetical protein